MSVQLHLCGAERLIQFGEGRKCRSNYTCAGTSGSSNSTKEGSVAAVALVLRPQAVHPIGRKRGASVQLHLYGPKRFIQFGEGKKCRSNYICMDPSGSFKSAKEGSAAATALARAQRVHPIPRRKKCREYYTCAGPRCSSNSTEEGSGSGSLKSAKEGGDAATAPVRAKRFIKIHE